MSNYRRHRVPGGTYFFTVNLLERKSTMLTEYIAELREAVRLIREQRPFHIDGWVVLPDHLHAIWTLPLGDVGYPERWREIKKAFSKTIPKTEYRSQTRINRHERGIWQRRYWEHTIRNEEDYAAHMDYLHYNPVKHGWVQSVQEWPYSSFHRLVQKGVYPPDWGASNLALIDVGEMDG
jgi:putative transposase